nr:uncharacterized protein LOC127314861 isoform X7 [Lolium perenne]
MTVPPSPRAGRRLCPLTSSPSCPFRRREAGSGVRVAGSAAAPQSDARFRKEHELRDPDDLELNLLLNAVVWRGRSNNGRNWTTCLLVLRTEEVRCQQGAILV